MTKDEQIAMLQETINVLRADRAAMVVTLQMALDRIPPFVERSAGAERRRRDADRKYRKRHPDDMSADLSADLSADISMDIADMSADCPQTGDYRGRTLPFGEEPSTDPGDQETELESQGESAERGSADSPQTNPADTEWDAFRETYPNLNRRTNWTKTRPAWARLSRANKPLAVLGAENYAACRDVLRGCEMSAIRWLNERRWESWQEPEELLPSQDDDRPAGAAGIQAWRDRQVAAGLMEAREPEKWASFEMPA